MESANVASAALRNSGFMLRNAARTLDQEGPTTRQLESASFAVGSIAAPVWPAANYTCQGKQKSRREEQPA
jgi:hypothetical protein